MKKCLPECVSPAARRPFARRNLLRRCVAAWLLLIAGFSEPATAATVVAWQPQEIAFTAANDHPWWKFPVRAEFKRAGDTEALTIEGFWDGGRRWVVRTALPRPGVWWWRTESADGGLSGHSGRMEVVAPPTDQIQGNPNLRGQVRIAASGRHFEYADGTPFFLLADTLWAGNTARCGLGSDGAGPFTDFLADRKAKGFTAVLMQLIHGYGDYPDGQAHRNEDGYAFDERDPVRLNASYFQSLDRRMQTLWERGFVAVTPTMWWGKTKQGLFTPEDARRLSAYCAVRYGAFNALWCVSGEYQYTFRDCGWTPADLSALGAEVQRHNPWRHPLSIHPSGNTTWKPPHNVQSSRPFHGEPWLDHHWLQTGQSLDRLCNIVTRLAGDRALQPAVPVFCSESFYEVATDPDSAYHARWQAWTAFLNGAAGYGYGVQGLWQFLDRSDPQGETGKLTDSRPVPWREAIRLPGSAQVGHARTLLASLPWWKLEPRRDALRVDGQPNPLPTKTDLTPPQAAMIGEKTWVIYLPRGNANLEVRIGGTAALNARGRWFDPRKGEFAGAASSITATVLPPRPKPADEDWVLLIE